MFDNNFDIQNQLEHVEYDMNLKWNQKMAITIATYSNLKHYQFFRFPEANITLKAHRDDPEREAKWKTLGFIPYKEPFRMPKTCA